MARRDRATELNFAQKVFMKAIGRMIKLLAKATLGMLMARCILASSCRIGDTDMDSTSIRLGSCTMGRGQMTAKPVMGCRNGKTVHIILAASKRIKGTASDVTYGPTASNTMVSG